MLENYNICKIRSIPDIYAELDPKYVKFEKKSFDEVADDLDHIEKSYQLQKLFLNKSFNFKIEYAQNLFVAQNLALSQCISNLKSTEPKQQEAASKPLNKILSYQIFCHYENLFKEYQPSFSILPLCTVNSEEITTFFLDMMVRLTSTIEIPRNFLPQYSLIYKYLLSAFDGNFVALEAALTQARKKFSANINELDAATIEDMIATIQEMFSENKMIVELYENWKTSYTDLLTKPLANKSFVEYTLTEKGGPALKSTALGGLAFVSDVYNIIIQQEVGVVKLLSKLLAIQAYFAKTRVLVALAPQKEIEDFILEIMVDYPLWLDPSCITLAHRISCQKKLRKSEVEFVKNFGIVLTEFLHLGCKFITNLPPDNANSVFGVESSILLARYSQLQDQLASQLSPDASPSTLLGEMLRNISFNYLETGNEELMESQKWLIWSYETLVRHRILFQSENENDLIRNKKLVIDFVVVAQSYLEKAPLEEFFKKNVNLLKLSSLLAIAVKHNFCRRVLDHSSFVKKCEQILIDLEQSSVDELITFGPNRKGVDVLGILHNFSVILHRCLQKSEGTDEDSQAAARNAHELYTFLLATDFFEKASHSKKYQRSEVNYLAIGFYLKAKLHVLNREQSSNPEHFQKLALSSSFLEFLEDYLKQSWEKFGIIDEILQFTNDETLQKSFLEEKGMLESMMLTSFAGRSLVAFQPVFGKIEKALFKYYVKRESAKKAALVEIFIKCKKELISQIEANYLKFPESVNQLDILAAVKQLTPLCGVSELLQVFSAGLKDEEHEATKASLETLDIQMLSCPLVLLYKHTKYAEMIHDIDLNTQYESELNENYQFLLKTFVKIQSEAGLLNLDEVEIAKGNMLLNLVEHYESHRNFKFPYFWGNFSLQSLKLAHYLEFITIHTTVDQNPRNLFNIPQAKEAFASFADWTQSFNLTPAQFLLIGVRIFLQLCENYIEASSMKEEKTENPKTYKKMSQAFFETMFYAHGANFIWNSLNYIFLTHGNPNYMSWDGLSLVEEYQNIELGDITNKKALTKKVFRNHVISKILQTALTQLSTTVKEGKKKKKKIRKVEFYGRNQMLFVASVIRNPKALEKLFNWNIAAASLVGIFDEIEDDEKSRWLEVFNNIAQNISFRCLNDKEADKRLFPMEDEEKMIDQANQALDYLIDTMPKIASKSLLLYSDVTGVAATILDFYKCVTLVAKQDDEKFQDLTLLKERLIWVLLELRSTPYFFWRVHGFDSYTANYAISSEKYMDIQELLTCELVEGKMSFLCPSVTSCADFYIEKEGHIANLMRKALCVNFAARTILLDKTKQEIEKKVELLFMLSDYLLKCFGHVFSLSEQRKDQTDNLIVALIQHYVDLTSRLPLLVGQILISFYLNAEEYPSKRRIWESVRTMCLLSYKYWKERIKFANVLVSYHFPVGKIFGMLHFLQSSMHEHHLGSHILEDPEIRHYLTTPNSSYEQNIELEALFLGQVLADYENRDILAEIELNSSISMKSWKKDENFVKYCKHAIQIENEHEPTWLVDYCETMLDLEYIEAHRKIAVKGKKSTAKDIWKLNYSIAEPQGIYEALCTCIHSQVKEIIDNICDSMLANLTQLSVAVDKSSSELAWCLVHLITIVDTQGYTTPYLSSKKFSWAKPEAYDPEKLFLPLQESERELGFIDVLIKIAFIYQPYIVENFVRGLMKKGIQYDIEGSSNPEQPITLGVILDLDLARAIDQALKTTLTAFKSKPRLYLVHIMNNYLKLLRILEDSFQSLLKALSGSKKVEVTLILQNLVNTVYAVLCEMLLRDDKFSSTLFDFKFCENFLEILYEELFEHQLGELVNWLSTNFSFILVNLEKVQACTKSIKPAEVLKLEYFISKARGNMLAEKKKLNEIKLRMFDGIQRQNTIRYYDLAEDLVPTEEMQADSEICQQVQKKQGQKGAMRFDSDCMKKFYFFYEVGDTQTNYQNIRKYFENLTLSSSMLAEKFEKISLETEEKLFARFEEKKKKLQEEEEKDKVLKETEEVKENEEIKENEEPKEPEDNIISHIESVINIEQRISNLVTEETDAVTSPSEGIGRREISVPSSKDEEVKKETSVIEEPVMMVDEDDSVEIMFLTDVGDLKKNCEKLPFTQKQFVECLFTQENEFILSTSELTIEKVMQNRKEFLKAYILDLPPSQAKLFVQYLPGFLKDQLEPKILNVNLFLPKHKETLISIIQDNNLLEQNNSEMFDLLNTSLAVLRKTLEKDLEAQLIDSPLTKPQKKDDSLLTEEYKATIDADASAFSENASQLQKAMCAITWLYQHDKELEILLINQLANRGEKRVYNQILSNPINQLRFLASMLLIIEDETLALFYQLTESHKKKIQLTYHQLCENALIILQEGCFQQLSMLVPSKALEAFVLPSVKEAEKEVIPEKCEIGNGFTRLIYLLGDDKYQLSADNRNLIIKIIHNYFVNEKPLYIVSESSSSLHLQFKHKILSRKLAEYISSTLLKISRSLDHDKKCLSILTEINKDINFLNSMKTEMTSMLREELKQVNLQINEVLSDLSKIQDPNEFTAKVESISKQNNLKALLGVIYLLSEPALPQFKGILGRKQFNDQNNQMNGKLLDWAVLLESFINEVTSSQDGKEFILSGFELICLEHKMKLPKISTTALQVFEILVKLKAVRVLVEEIAVPLKGSVESEGIDGLPLNSLQRVISRDVTEAPQYLGIVATFSQMRRECESLSINEIYNFSLVKMKKEFINKLLDAIAPNDTSKSLFCLKFSFYQNLAQKEQSSGIRRGLSSQKTIEINRDTHLQDSINAYTFSAEEKSQYKPRISYKNEIGYDAGGLLRAWLEQNTKILFDPGFGLFHRAENPRLIHPNPVSRIIPDRLIYFEYTGYHVALAIRTNSPIDVHFTKSFYKMMLDRPLTLDDLEEIDSHLFTGLRWTLQNDAEDLLQTFSYQSDFLGKRYVIELVPEGSKIPVTNRNKQLYVKLLAMSKMQKEIASEIESFLFGFNQVLSSCTLQNFSPRELEAVIAGASKIDIQDMKKYTKVSSDYSEEFLDWFWELLEEFDENERSAFVYYISGSTNVSHGGFKDQPIALHYMNDSEKLPVAHTCFRSLDLPQYASKEILREKLLTAIYEGVGAFQIQ